MGHHAAILDTSDGGLVTIAGTGAGKGVSQVIPAQLTWRGSVVVNDPKGELYAITARCRREMGQRVSASIRLAVRTRMRSIRWSVSAAQTPAQLMAVFVWRRR